MVDQVLRRLGLSGLLMVGLVVHLGPLASGAEPEPVRFNRDIRPILSQNCWHCHGPGKQSAGLRLDVRDNALKPGESGDVAIVPNQPAKSELVRRIFSNDKSEMMPPENSHKVLKPEQKELLKRWVAEGAVYEKHWSFEAPVKSPVPKVEGPGFRVQNPIDQFIADRLKREGLKMTAPADKSTLIRRVAFALTGLPPTLKELDEYMADHSPQAYEKLVDRYLASPKFGEEMARHWLDVARYADTHGLHLDNERQMWLYRDWVVQAFHENKRFDQFTIEQLAGDLLPNASQKQLVATGFNRCNVTTGEGGSINEEWIYRNAIDRTNTTIEAWLGMTGGCAQCHDHKFDPLTQKDYYSLYAFFNSADVSALDGNAAAHPPVVKMATPQQEKQLAELEAKLAAVQKKLDEQAKTVFYKDPAEQQPVPTAQDVEVVWLEDEFPANAKPMSTPGQPTTWVTAEQGEVYSGKRALKRTGTGIVQDYYEGGADPLVLPESPKLFAYVWLSAIEPPKAVMLQFHKGGWMHRAVWGDYDIIPWGKAKSFERVHMGPLPETGKWVRLEIEAAKLGLQAGDRITGLAYTQFDGTVYWDKAGVVGRSDPVNDARRSFAAWRKQQAGKDTAGLSPELNKLLKAGPAKQTPEQVQQLLTHYVQAVCVDTKSSFEQLRSEQSQVQKERDQIDGAMPRTFIYKDLPKPREAFVMLRGQYDKPGEKVEPNTPTFLPALKKASAESRANRLDLAQWLVSAEQPLTSRVTVNRFWQQFFGTGLVKTSFDFGSQGELPSHPELLDWLSVHFRETGWDVKGLIKLMLMSATFQQATNVTPELLQKDPENRLYARGPRFRLDAEQIRDNALFVSGLMNPEMGGKGVNPYQPPNIWEPVGFTGSNTRVYKQDTGPALYRRSLYVFLKRTAPAPFMANFDAPNRETFCTRRERSNTPLQALQLMNDVQHFEAARRLAERILTEAGATPADRISFAYRVILSRPPEPAELTIVERALVKHRERFKADPKAAQQAISLGESKPDPKLPAEELAAYTLLANLLLNLDETVTRN